jgi:hypothetical protein
MEKPKVAIVKTPSLVGTAEFMPPVKKYKHYAEDVDAIEAAVAKAVELTVGHIDNLIKPGQVV